MTDRVVTVIPNVTLRAGLMGVKSRQYSVVITEQQFIFARMTTAKMTQLSEQARTHGAAPTSAFAMLSDAYGSMSPEAILAEHADNFAVPRADITKVKVKAGGAYDGGAGNDLLLIVTPAKKYKLTLMGSASAVRQTLEQVGY